MISIVDPQADVAVSMQVQELERECEQERHHCSRHLLCRVWLCRQALTDDCQVSMTRSPELSVDGHSHEQATKTCILTCIV